MAADFFVVPTATYCVLFALVMLAHDSPTRRDEGRCHRDRGLDRPTAARSGPWDEAGQLQVSAVRRGDPRGSPQRIRRAHLDHERANSTCQTWAARTCLR